MEFLEIYIDEVILESRTRLIRNCNSLVNEMMRYISFLEDLLLERYTLMAYYFLTYI